MAYYRTHPDPELTEAVPPRETPQPNRYPVPNADTVHTYRVAVPVFNAPSPAARWLRLPDLFVPDSMYLLIKAWPGNPVGSLVFIAETPAYVVNPDTAYPLMPNEPVAYKVANAAALYVSASVPNCWVIVSAEQRRTG